MATLGIALRVRGKVQGVGFRPMVWQQAHRLRLRGDVGNDGAGVVIRVVGAGEGLKEGLIAALYAACPPLARIDEITCQPLHWQQLPPDFTIRHSTGEAMRTQIAPDAATCTDCLNELHDPKARRYRYPLINCTHCGPRITIIRAMPYDRPFTALATFPLCAACEREYRDPRDRRFHAQPVACAQCGPWLSWQSAGELLEKEPALAAAIAALRAGKIVAIKGIGGFHLACDAADDTAVARLRQRKQRPTKPLAVMMPLEPLPTTILPAAARRWLTSSAAPIVLINKASLQGLSPLIAPGLDEVGMMLPANPLQHLLMQEFNGPLVMTSGNLAGRPPALSNQQALADLATIADGWLLHNRDIVQRMDDSVMRASGEMLRRSRGFVPDALPLPPGFDQVPSLLCLGADLKNTFCLVRGNQAVVSQHFGDLTDEAVVQQWHRMRDLMCQIYDFQPQQVVIDAHPGYRSAALGRQMALPVQTVLHHHAHAAACLAEHGWPLDGGKVLALVLDGLGWGEQGALWGGECLRMDYRHCEHLGGLPAVALPGGDRAAYEPWRNLLAHCLAFVPHWQCYPPTAVISQHHWQPLARAVERGINAPCASSTGRLFDAVAAALGCAATQQRYQGEAACQLEALALCCAAVDHPVSMPLLGNQLDLATFWQQWLQWSATPAELAWAFHDALAAGLAQLVRQQASRWGIMTVVCSGGALHNRLLRQRLSHYLADYHLLFPQQLPAGDGGIAFGQGVIAAARGRASSG